MKALLVVSLVVVSVGGSAAFAVSNGMPNDDCSLARFDSRGWIHSAPAREEPGGGATQRQRLADRLIECETLLGTRRSRVREILGRPDNYVAQGTRFYANGSWEDGTWSYTLGTQRAGFPIDDEHLVVRFGREGRVRSTELATD